MPHILVFVVPYVVIFLYTTCSLIMPLKLRLAVKLLLAVVILFFEMKYVIYHFFGGALTPRLPMRFIVVMEFMGAAIMLAFGMALIKDVVLLIGVTLRRFAMHDLVFPHQLINYGIIIVALALALNGMHEVFRVPQVVSHELELPGLERKLDGLRVVQLTDLHVGPLVGAEFTQGVVERTNELKPDLVVITGDFVDGRAEEVGPELSALRELQATHGVYAVTGNHEYYSGAEEWIEALSGLGMKFLENEHVVIPNANLTLAGVPDGHAGRFGFAPPDVERALADAPPGPRILLAHQPAQVAGYEDRAELILTGHTHGGTMFFLQPLIKLANHGYVSGMYGTPEHRLYVSNGTGIWAGFPCRVLVPAEITLFTLRSPDAAQSGAEQGEATPDGASAADAP